jgi:large subunit ribosomal protein L17
MMGNLAVALITHGRIQTTLTKAKALRPFIEKVITLAKKAEAANDAARKLHFRRLAISRVRDKQAVAKLFDELVTEFTARSGGYTRIYKIGQRVGDAAEVALIELIDGNDEGYSKKPAKKAAKKATKKAAKKEEAPAAEEAEAPAAAETEAPAAAETEAPAAEAPAAEEKKPVKKAAKKAAKKTAKKAAKKATKKATKKED